MTECNCEQKVWLIVGPIPACPVHDLCGTRGCNCGRQPCPYRSGHKWPQRNK